MRRWHSRRNQALRGVGPTNRRVGWRRYRQEWKRVLKGALPRWDGVLP